MRGMEATDKRTPLRLHFVFLVLAYAALSSQCCGQIPLSRPVDARTKASNSARIEPKPEDAITAILASFDRYEVVGIDVAHGRKDLDDLILHLVRVRSQA